MTSSEKKCFKVPVYVLNVCLLLKTYVVNFKQKKTPHKLSFFILRNRLTNDKNYSSTCFNLYLHNTIWSQKCTKGYIESLFL